MRTYTFKTAPLTGGANYDLSFNALNFSSHSVEFEIEDAELRIVYEDLEDAGFVIIQFKPRANTREVVLKCNREIEISDPCVSTTNLIIDF